MEITKKGIIQVIVVLAMLLVIIYIASTQSNEQYTEETKQGIISLKSNIEIMKGKAESIIKVYNTKENNEYNGTIEPFKYIVDVIYIDFQNNSVYGITSNKDTYSGLMRYDFSETEIDIREIENFETYSITCKPLIKSTIDNEKVTPYVMVMSIEKSTDDEKIKLQNSKEELSKYIEFKVINGEKPLDDIVQAANEEFYKWTNDDITDYQEWIQSLGYTNDKENGVVSIVKTIEQLKNEQ